MSNKELKLAIRDKCETLQVAVMKRRSKRAVKKLLQSMELKQLSKI